VDVLNTVLRVLLAVLFVIATASMAAGDGSPASVEDTLKFIAFSGIFAGAFISAALENFAWFQKLTSLWKRVVVGAFVTVLPALSIFLMNTVPSGVWAIIEPFWPVLVTAIIGWVGSQVYHSVVNRST